MPTIDDLRADAREHPQPPDLEQVLANWRGDAAVLRARKHDRDAELIETLCAEVALAAEEWLTFIDEGRAAIHSGRTEATIRAKYETLARRGHARTVNGRRQYRQCMIEQRAQIDQAAERGREAARAVREDLDRRRAS